MWCIVEANNSSVQIHGHCVCFTCVMNCSLHSTSLCLWYPLAHVTIYTLYAYAHSLNNRLCHNRREECKQDCFTQLMNYMVTVKPRTILRDISDSINRWYTTHRTKTLRNLRKFSQLHRIIVAKACATKCLRPKKYAHMSHLAVFYSGLLLVYCTHFLRDHTNSTSLPRISEGTLAKTGITARDILCASFGAYCIW